MLTKTLATLGAAAILTLLTSSPAQAGDDSGWRLKLTGASVQSTAGGAPDGDLGAGLGLEYRASRHVGVELDVLNSNLEDEQDFALFDFRFTLETSLRVTPVLARLNFHLTPDRRADFYLGPVVGWMRYGDIEVRLRGGDFPSTEALRVPTRDSFAWGAHLGVDLPVGDRGLFLTGGATYLKAEVKTESDGFFDTGALDLDPLIAHLGLGYRF